MSNLLGVIFEEVPFSYVISESEAIHASYIPECSWRKLECLNFSKFNYLALSLNPGLIIPNKVLTLIVGEKRKDNGLPW